MANALFGLLPKLVAEDLESLGFTFQILGATAKGASRARAIVEDQRGVRRFLKIAWTPEGRLEVENQIRAEEFLKTKITDERIIIPKGELIQTKYATIGSFEFLDGVPFWMIDRGWSSTITNEDREALFSTLMNFAKIPEEQVPPFFLDRARVEFDETYHARRFWEYAEAGIPKVITRDEAEQLSRFVTPPFAHQLSHHDVMLWHWLRVADGRTALIGAEYARWGLKWYDFAYFILQTWIYLEHGEDEARIWLKLFLDREPAAEKELLAPLAFRLSANIALAAKEFPAHIPRIRAILPKILAGDVKGLLE
jgi:hypothetical protein